MKYQNKRYLRHASEPRREAKIAKQRKKNQQQHNPSFHRYILNFMLAIVKPVPFVVCHCIVSSSIRSSRFSISKSSFVVRTKYWLEFHFECNDFSDLMLFNDSYQCSNAYVSIGNCMNINSFPYRSLVNFEFLFAFFILTACSHLMAMLSCVVLDWFGESPIQLVTEILMKIWIWIHYSTVNGMTFAFPTDYIRTSLLLCKMRRCVTWCIHFGKIRFDSLPLTAICHMLLFPIAYFG